MQGRAEPGDTVEVGEIERHQSGGSAVLSDLVVELFQSRLRTRHRHHMRAGFCQRPRGGIADAARGAGDESDTGGKGEGHSSKLYVVPANAGPIRRDGYEAEGVRIKWRPKNESRWLGPRVPGCVKKRLG